MNDEGVFVDVSHGNGIAVVTVRGEVDAHSVGRLDDVLRTLEEHVVIDMSGVAFMDSSGIELLVAHARRLAQIDRSVRLRNPSPAVRRVVLLTGASRLYSEPHAAARAVSTKARSRTGGRRCSAPPGRRDRRSLR
jgi:anti-anti-sigma factor